MGSNHRFTPSSLPRGFSIYQPMVGAPLQFLPALGSPELDDMINAFVPGPSRLREKRSVVALDFCQHAMTTGETCKFYTVQPASSAATSPATGSPSAGSSSSSFNSSVSASPLTPSWNWSAISLPSTAPSPRPASQRRRRPKVGKSSSFKYSTIDVSNLPGMRILNKAGDDVTNTASRGSKTEEQRRHAHCMRKLKACDECRRKKVRCDPSHKNGGAAQVAPPQSKPVPASKTRATPSKVPPPVPSPPAAADSDMLFSMASSTDLDPIFSFTGLGDFDSAVPTCYPLDEIAESSAMGIPDFNFLPDTIASASSQYPQSYAPPTLQSSADSLQQGAAEPPGPVLVNTDLPARFLDLPLLTQPDMPLDYTDFNLYSPSTVFSEDEHMLSVSAADVNSAANAHSAANRGLPSLTTVSQPELTQSSSATEINLGIIDVPQITTDAGLGDTVHRSCCQRHSGGGDHGHRPVTTTSLSENLQGLSSRTRTPMTHTESQHATVYLRPGDTWPGGLTLSNSSPGLGISTPQVEPLDRGMGVVRASVATRSTDVQMLSTEHLNRQDSDTSTCHGPVSALAVSVERNAGLSLDGGRQVVDPESCAALRSRPVLAIADHGSYINTLSRMNLHLGRVLKRATAHSLFRGIYAYASQFGPGQVVNTTWLKGSGTALSNSISTCLSWHDNVLRVTNAFAKASAVAIQTCLQPATRSMSTDNNLEASPVPVMGDAAPVDYVVGRRSCPKVEPMPNHQRCTDDGFWSRRDTVETVHPSRDSAFEMGNGGKCLIPFWTKMGQRQILSKACGKACGVPLPKNACRSASATLANHVRLLLLPCGR